MLSRLSQGTLRYKELTLFIKGWNWGPPLSTSSIAMFFNKKRVGGWTNGKGGIKRKRSDGDNYASSVQKCASNSFKVMPCLNQTG